MAAKTPRTRRRLLLWLLAVPLSLLAIALVSLFFWVHSYLTPEALVLQLEKDKNLRAEVDSIKVNLLTHPAAIEIRGLRLAATDDAANKALPLKNRTPLTKEQTLVSVDRGVVRIGLPALISKELDLRHMILSNVVINGTIDEKGDNNIEEIFQKRPKPKPVAGTPPKPAKPPRKKPVTFTRIGLGGIEGGRIEFNLVKDRKILRFEPEKIQIDGSVDQERLEETNTVHTVFTGKFTLVDLDRNQDFATFDLAGKGDVYPYNLTTKKLDPAFDFTLRLRKGSTVAALPVSDLLRNKPKEIERMEDFGFKPDLIVTGGALREDTDVLISQQEERLFLRKDFLMFFDNFGLGLEKGDYVNLENRDMRIRPRFVASEEMSNKLEGMVRERLAQKTSDDIASLLSLILKPLRDEQNRISFSLKVKGEFSDPEVGINSAIGEIGGAIGGLIQGLFKDEDDKDKKKKEQKDKPAKQPAAPNPNAAKPGQQQLGPKARQRLQQQRQRQQRLKRQQEQERLKQQQAASGTPVEAPTAPASPR